MMIKTIVFDFGRVIADFNHMIICRKLINFSNLSAEEIYERIFKNGLEKQYDEGKIDFRRFHQEVIEKISADRKPTIETFKRIWVDIFSDNPGIKEVLARIRPEVKMLLLSNTNQVHWDYISQLSVIKGYFSKEENLILSFRLGFRKPDQRIFLEAIKRSGCRPKEIIYIDDISKYVVIAKKLEMYGITYNCQTDPPEKLLKVFSKFNILIE